MAATADTTGSAPSAATQSSGAPQTGKTDAVPWLTDDQAVHLALYVIGGVVVVGIVLAIVRAHVKKEDEPPASVVRSWIAVSLVLGLLAFCAVTFAIDDVSLRSTLFGGLTTSVGAAVAFYFASQTSDKARADILGAMGRSGSPPTTFTSDPPPAGTVGTTYSFQFMTDGYPAPTYATTSGSLPKKLKLSPEGILSGTPTVAGDYTFGVKASNNAGTLSREDFAVTVAPAATNS